ncbi:MAG: glycosyltransferase family 2 protein [Rhodoglobus sp.]
MAVDKFLARVRGGVARRSGRLVRKLITRRLVAGHFGVHTVDFGPQTGREADVVMCLWNRPSRLDNVLDLLDTQDYEGGINLYLWNNNRTDHSHYRTVIAQFEASGAVKRVSLARSPYNVGSIGRFYWARKLASHNSGGAVIVIDDDQDFEPDFISTALSEFDPALLKAWWAWIVSNEYHNRKPAGVGDRVDHIGPGGSVLPLAIFADPRFFTDIPDHFRMLDDLWLTFFATRSGYQLAKLPVEMSFVMDETNQYHSQITMKSDFYNYLYK